MINNDKETVERIVREVADIVTDLDPKYSLRYQEVAGLHVLTVYDGDTPLGIVKTDGMSVRFRPPAFGSEGLHSEWSTIASKISNELGSFFAALNQAVAVAKGELVERISGVAMDLVNFERFLAEWYFVKRIAPGEWDVRHKKWEGLFPLGIVTALKVGDGLSVAVWCYEWDIPREGFVETDADGNVWEFLDTTETYGWSAHNLARDLRDALQQVGSLTVAGPIPVEGKPTFDQRGQSVGTQINVAGNYIAGQPVPHAESAVTSAILDPAIVRIYTAQGRVAGAGFLAGERRVLTCAHVVAAALGLPDDAPEAPQADVQLDFPLLAPGRRFTARVTAWQAQADVAGLELTGSPPAEAAPVSLLVASNLWGHLFRAFGFPAGHEDGVWASGRILGRQAGGWVQIEDVKQTGYFVASGFSGGPVWDETAGGVVGMIIAAERQPGVRAAFLIPATALRLRGT
jgi:S1-C subfamily serine protease